MQECPKAFDRNRQEIKVGDRVRILGEEVREFLKEWYGDNLDEKIYRDCKDEIGTAKISEYGFLVEDENGDMLFDLSTCYVGGEPCLEVVGSYEEETLPPEHTKASSEQGQTQISQNSEAADTSRDVLAIWFSEETAADMLQILSKHYEPPKKCVYILQMKNSTVKIGVTQEFAKRKNTISTSSGLDVIKWCHTDNLPSRKAYEIESTCHKIFRGKRIKGEFFNVSFDDAVAELQKHTEVIEYSD